MCRRVGTFEEQAKAALAHLELQQLLLRTSMEELEVDRCISELGL